MAKSSGKAQIEVEFDTGMHRNAESVIEELSVVRGVENVRLVKKDRKAVEQQLMDEVEELGLVRDVVHEICDYPQALSPNTCDNDGCMVGYFWHYGDDGKATGKTPCPKCKGTGKQHKKPRRYIGITWVRLFTKEDWAKKRKEHNDSLAGFVGEGRANCSELEGKFDKREGRIIATGRALADYQKQSRAEKTNGD